MLCISTWPAGESLSLPVQNSQIVISNADESFAIPSSDEKRRPLIEQLRWELSQLHAIPDMTIWLQMLVVPYDTVKEPLNVIQTDLDQDGVSNEWVVVLYEDRRDERLVVVQERKSYGVILAFKESKFTLQSFEFSSVNDGRSKIMTIMDLTGDSKPEVVWVSMNSGAHTTFYTYTVSAWRDSKLETYKGSAIMASVSKAEIRDKKLQLTGGLIGSVGAGPWQMEYTESYSISRNELKRTQRAYTQTPTPYHRLISGLWAESHGNLDQALREYTEAAEMRAVSYQEYAFIFNGEWVEGGIKPDQEAEFERVVQRFSQLRKQLLIEVTRGNDPVTACMAVKKNTGFEAAWLPYLNAPAGYANPHWEEGTICSDVSVLEQ